MAVQAVWNGIVLARSDASVVVESNHYFPPDSAVRELFSPSPTRTSCPIKGVACYLAVTAGGQTLPDAAWFYPQPNPAAAQIRNLIAFSPNVQVVPA